MSNLWGLKSFNDFTWNAARLTFGHHRSLRGRKEKCYQPAIASSRKYLVTTVSSYQYGTYEPFYECHEQDKDVLLVIPHKSSIKSVTVKLKKEYLWVSILQKFSHMLN